VATEVVEQTLDVHERFRERMSALPATAS